MHQPPSPGGPPVVAGPGTPAPARRGMRERLAVGAPVVLSVAALVAWMSVAQADDDAVGNFIETHDDACAAFHPSPTVWSLFSFGLVCALVPLATRAVPGRNRWLRPGTGVTVTAVVVLVLQAGLFYLRYLPAGSEVSSHFLTSTYCSGG